MPLQTTSNKSGDRPRHTDLKARGQQRSRISNHRDVLPNVDGRGTIARRYRDIASQIATDQGGLDRCSESRLQLIRRFAATAVLAEQIEADLANGKQISITEHALLCSTLVRIGHRIGLNRIPREVEDPTLQLFNRELARLESEDADHTEIEP